MPTFFDSTADAAEASEALRGLAHASRGFDQPAEMYGVIGDLSWVRVTSVVRLLGLGVSGMRCCAR